jgi:S-formylglutathione hydrolase
MTTMVKRHRSHGGWVEHHEHQSSATGTAMRFAVYLPPQAETKPLPVVYWLSGLTCTDENFMAKAGAQAHAARLGLILVAPDTSPRGAGIPGEDDSWDFGTGAGFYVDAVQEPWSRHYRMYSYVRDELRQLVEHRFPVRAGARSIMGHSMGGHGALVLALRNPDLYAAVSAFSPIVAPSQCPWGEKAFQGYLGTDRELWLAYDATALVKGVRERRPILIDQGTADEFLEGQLKTALFKEACAAVDHPLELRMQEGYDHSYYFIASFIGDHLERHAAALSRL